jgi:hypothetical protein
VCSSHDDESGKGRSQSPDHKKQTEMETILADLYQAKVKMIFSGSGDGED